MAEEWSVPSDEGAVLRLTPTLLGPSEATEADEYVRAIVVLEMRVDSLRVGPTTGEEGPLDLWQLTWSPPLAAEPTNIFGLPAGVDSGHIGFRDPFSIPDLQSPKERVVVQLVACASCLPARGYAGSVEVDKDEWGVAGLTHEPLTLSFTTPSYPWRWLSRVYWWIIPILAAPVVAWSARAAYRVALGGRREPPRS